MIDYFISNGRRARCRQRALVAMSLTLLFCSGCGSSHVDERVRYADGWQQYTNHNGLGIHREMWRQVDARCYAPKRLSNRLNTFDVIVLVGNTFSPPGKQAREWLEDWLRKSPGRTVLYFGRDFDATEFYYQRTRSKLSASEQELVDEQIAASQALELRDKLDSYSDNAFCDWFYLKADEAPKDVDYGSGSWSDRVSQTDSLPMSWPIHTRLLPPDLSFQEPRPDGLTVPKPANPLTPINSPSVQNSEKVLLRSIWQPDEHGTVEAWDSAFENLLSSEILMESEDGVPLVFRLTDSKRLGDGQILVVANGAPLLNASLVQPQMFEIGKLLIGQCLPARRVALMVYDDSGIQISLVDEADSRGTGLEMFLYWPMRPIVMLSAVLMLVVCLRYLPTLGRGQDLPRESTSDFGQHAEAIGSLLRQTGDESYARRTIAHYFRTVRNESPPPWLEIESETEQSG